MGRWRGYDRRMASVQEHNDTRPWDARLAERLSRGARVARGQGKPRYIIASYTFLWLILGATGGNGPRNYGLAAACAVTFVALEIRARAISRHDSHR